MALEDSLNFLNGSVICRRNTGKSENNISERLASNPFLVKELSNPTTRKEVRERALTQKNGAIASGNSASFDLFSGLYELTNALESIPQADEFVYSANQKEKDQTGGFDEKLFNLRDDFLFA